MTLLIVLAAISLFAAGAATGIIGVASLAIHQEEKHRTLAHEASGTLAQTGRWLNGVHIQPLDRTVPADQHAPPALRPRQPGA